MTIFQWRPLLKPDGVFATTDMGRWGQSLLFLVWSMIRHSGRVTIPVPRRGSGKAFVKFLKERIEAAWEQAGLMTFNALLRRDLDQARPSS